MLETKNIYLRLVNSEDVDFIIFLRTNKNLNKFLSAVNLNKDDQLSWLADYKIREMQGIDYYFVIVDKVIGATGLIRLYNIDYDLSSFEWGSWILAEGHPKYTALDSALLSYEFGFNELNLRLCKIKVDNNNVHARQFYERFGSEIVAIDHKETFFQLTKEKFLQLKYSRYYQYFLKLT